MRGSMAILKMNKKLLVVITAVVIIALIAAACGASEVSAPTSAPTPITTAAAEERHQEEGHTHEPTIVEGAREVVLVAREWAFEPESITVSLGEPVTLVLVNDGVIRHEVDIPAFDFYLLAEAGTIATGVLIPDKVGTFEFACEIQGHREAGMVGTLIVYS